MRALRTRFKKEIVAEFLPPRKKSSKAIIFLSGMPAVPCRNQLLEFFSKKGYWVFYPRYQGSWESGGEFLKKSPEQDALKIINELPKGFKDLWNDKTYKIRPSKIYLFGGSFGGTGAILASLSPKVTKAVAFSPVIDWRAETKAEPHAWYGKFVKNAFGEAYRFSRTNWMKLKNGKFYSPMYCAKKINGEKIMIIHSKDDESVPWKPAVKFSKINGSRLLLIRRGGHFGLGNFMEPKFYKKIKKFLKQ